MKIKFVLALTLWGLILYSLIGIKEYTLNSGTPIVLKSVPVDPWDFFRGQYVTLKYEISDISPALLKEEEIFYGDKVYVALEKKGKYQAVKYVSKEKPKDEKLVLKAKVTNYANKKNTLNNIAVKYGIETFFVPEGKGKEIEESKGKDLEVVVVVDKFGNSIIKELLINGKPIKL